MGEVPPWYMVIRAARYLGVAPWDLMEQPQVWQAMALEAESAELQQQNQQRKKGLGV